MHEGERVQELGPVLGCDRHGRTSFPDNGVVHTRELDDDWVSYDAAAKAPARASRPAPSRSATTGDPRTPASATLCRAPTPRW